MKLNDMLELLMLIVGILQLAFSIYAEYRCPGKSKKGGCCKDDKKQDEEKDDTTEKGRKKDNEQ